MPNDFYVYLHLKADNSEVFYVGKGRGKRAGRKNGRNNHWKNVVNKHGFKCKIISQNLSEKQAFELEIIMIDFYKVSGSRLVNLTNGGEGNSGIVITQERKEYLSKINSGSNNPFYGKQFTDEHKKNISLSKIGDKHHLYDKIVRVYFHVVHGYEITTRYEMMRKYEIDATNISRLIKGKQKKASGWVLI